MANLEVLKFVLIYFESFFMKRLWVGRCIQTLGRLLKTYQRFSVRYDGYGELLLSAACLALRRCFFINVRCIIKSHIYSSWVLRFYVWYIFYYEMKWSQVFWKEVYIYYPMVVKLFVKLLWMSLENKKSVGSFTLLVLLCNLKNLSL